MLKYRLIFGPIMIAILVGALYLDEWMDDIDLSGTFVQDLFGGRSYLPSGLLLLFLFLIIIALTVRELCRIFAAEGFAVQPPVMVVAAWLGCFVTYAMPHQLDSQTTLALLASILSIVFLGSLVTFSWRKGRVEGAIAAGAATTFVMIYAGLLPGFYLAIRRWHSAWIIAAIMLVTKSCDIGAFFTGRAIGKRKLIPWLSPGKTWEGLAGGLLMSAGVAASLAAALNAVGMAGYYQSTGGERVFIEQTYPILPSALAGALFGLIGQFGDLTASLFKRDAGIKDSGASVPGFGGVIDIVDSPIVVAPVAYWALMLAREWQ